MKNCKEMPPSAVMNESRLHHPAKSAECEMRKVSFSQETKQSYSALAECEMRNGNPHLNLFPRKVTPAVTPEFIFSERLYKAQPQSSRSANAERLRRQSPFPRKVVPTGAKTLATTLLVLSTLSSCQKLRDNLRLDELDIPKGGPVAATDYSLESSGCVWDFSNAKEDSTYIISDSAELLNFILCSGSSTPPSIDFDQYSLLLVHGQTNSNGITSIAKSLERFGIQEYQFKIDILLNDTAVPQPWHIAMLVPKLPQNAMIDLTVGIRCEDTIPFTDYPISPFGSLTRDSLYVINSDAELLTITANIPSPIDWNNNTLLYAGGPYPCVVSNIDTVLLKNYCVNQYTLDISITGYLLLPTGWSISILTPKIPNNTNITFNLKKN